ncbi:MAG: DUF5009 domain-containing protein [Luteimonas sp.]|nr:DUF5009 domain-containing protein [Luteimonas sp.]
MLLVNTPGDWGHVYTPLLHSEWHGSTPTDLVFPFFLFVVGVSIALGVLPRREAGVARTTLQRDVLLRASRIVLLGLGLHAIAWLALQHPYFRPWGVLQRIGVCFGVVALLALHTRVRTQWLCLAALLLGYWALLATAGTYAPWTNFASRLDTAMLGALAYRFDAATGLGHDPEGLVSTLGAIATTLLGLRAGDWLRHGQLRRLCAAGLAVLVLGAAWAQVLPINKNLWTSSYVLWSGGWALLALVACHIAIDLRGWPALGRRFGVNAIAAYAGSALMTYVLAALDWWEPIYRVGFASWMTPHSGPYLPSLLFAVAFVLFWWLVVWWMDRRGWRVRI